MLLLKSCFTFWSGNHDQAASWRSSPHSQNRSCCTLVTFGKNTAILAPFITLHYFRVSSELNCLTSSSPTPFRCHFSLPIFLLAHHSTTFCSLHILASLICVHWLKCLCFCNCLRTWLGWRLQQTLESRLIRRFVHISFVNFCVLHVLIWLKALHLGKRHQSWFSCLCGFFHVHTCLC